jgi:phosphatidylglycerol:prolipoprotein diacylglycerol transferase
MAGILRGDAIRTMPLYILPFPVFDPVLLELGPLQIRWYALAYIFGLLLGWFYARSLVGRAALWGHAQPPSAAGLDDLLVFVALGVVLGGRLGYVLFYNLPYFIDTPSEIIAVWHGGMSFHGGLIGAVAGVWWFAKRHDLAVAPVADLCATVAPIGLLLGRLANFIKPELWGRVSDVPWAMVFPGAGPLPRHPSQLYEAGLEGVLLFCLLAYVVRAGGLRRPWCVSGVFAIGYGLARICAEFFREPDPQLGFLFGGATMGMVLSLPLIAVGVVCLWRAFGASEARSGRGE